MSRFENDGVVQVGSHRVGDHANLNDGETITLGDKVFEYRAAGPATGSNILVLKGGNAAAAITALKAAIDAAAILGFSAGALIEAVIDSVDSATLRIFSTEPGDREIAFETTMIDSDNIIAASGSDTLSHGERASNKKIAASSYTVTAVDEAAGSILIKTGLQNPTRLQLDCWSSDGVQRVLETKFTLVSGRIKGEYDGSDNPVEGDVINWEVWS